MGTLDASGAAPGSIALNAVGNLTLDGTAVLDAHATKIAVDSYGEEIDASNQGACDADGDQRIGDARRWRGDRCRLSGRRQSAGAGGGECATPDQRGGNRRLYPSAMSR